MNSPAAMSSVDVLRARERAAAAAVAHVERGDGDEAKANRAFGSVATRGKKKKKWRERKVKR